MSDLKPQKYKDERPPEAFAKFHERSRTKEPDFVYEVVRMVTTPISLLFYRATQKGVENVPETGPVILAPNHASNMDHFLCGVYLRRKIRFMAKSQLFANPIGNFIFTHGGVFPIRRGHRDDEAFITARTILTEQNGCVLVYAEGGRSRTGGLGEPKPGVGRVALESGAPVVPVAIHGSLGVRAWKRGRFPKIRIRYGEPMSFGTEPDPSRERQQEVAEQVFEPVRKMYAELEKLDR